VTAVVMVPSIRCIRYITVFEKGASIMPACCVWYLFGEGAVSLFIFFMKGLSWVAFFRGGFLSWDVFPL
jgi:hypothetical protein